MPMLKQLLTELECFYNSLFPVWYKIGKLLMRSAEQSNPHRHIRHKTAKQYKIASLHPFTCMTVLYTVPLLATMGRVHTHGTEP